MADVGHLAGELAEVLSSGIWTVRAAGARPCRTEQFESAWAARCGTQFALAMTSGSAALDLGLRAIGVHAGDEVVVPALGWHTPAAAVLRLGATPVFADVDERTSCIDPTAAAAVLTGRTKALIAVHLHCAAADLDALCELAAEHRVALVEDCSQAHGMSWAGRPVGSHGTLGCFSFNQEKLLPAGEAGAIVTSDRALYECCYVQRTDGYRIPVGGRRVWTADGRWTAWNACPSELQAALLLDQLTRFDELQAVRERNALALERSLQALPWVRPLDPGRRTTTRSWYEFGIVLNRAELSNWPIERIAARISAELGVAVGPTDDPMPTTPLLGPARLTAAPERTAALRDALLVLPHPMLLADGVADAVLAALHALHRATRAADQG